MKVFVSAASSQKSTSSKKELKVSIVKDLAVREDDTRLLKLVGKFMQDSNIATDYSDTGYTLVRGMKIDANNVSLEFDTILDFLKDVRASVVRMKKESKAFLVDIRADNA